MGCTFQRGAVWWISYYRRGHQFRESTHSTRESDANRMLKLRLGEIATNRFVQDEAKVTFEDLAQGLVMDYELNRRASLKTAARNNISHLRSFFGFDGAMDITLDRVRSYQALRVKQGASVATANRETGTLRRMFSLAIEAGKLTRKPVFKMLMGEKVRQGFVDHADFLRLLGELPGHVRSFVEFLYHSGWRKGAAQDLKWSEVNMGHRTISLEMEEAGKPKVEVLPLQDRLWEIIQERHRVRRLDIPSVFHHKGRGVGDIRKAWASACKRAGLSGLLVHDLRRSAARNLSKAGVKEAVAMKITGHRTRNMYLRYRIVDEDELREAHSQLQSYLDSQPKISKVAVIGAMGSHD